MFERFSREARQAVTDAEAEARALGSSTIDAEHLLLALARHDGTLAAAGLDHDSVLEALAAERERSLAAVGVNASDFELPSPVMPPKPRFATSSKRTLELALRVALVRRDKRISGGHILLALLLAEAGTVPRALEQAGVDRDELRARIEAEMNR